MTAGPLTTQLLQFEDETEPDGAHDPLLHSVHACVDEAATALDHEPAAQLRQLLAPAMDEYVPDVQFWQKIPLQKVDALPEIIEASIA